MITGENKKEFEKWLILSEIAGKMVFGFNVQSSDFDNAVKSMWDKLPFEMQIGVYLAYYDSLGIYITMIPNWKKGIRTFRVGYHYEFGGVIDSEFLRPEKDSPFFNEYSTRNEAYKEAFKKADEIVNTESSVVEKEINFHCDCLTECKGLSNCKDSNK